MFGTTEQEEQTKLNPFLMIREEARGNKMARKAASTGLSGNEWIVKEIVDELNNWGYGWNDR